MYYKIMRDEEVLDVLDKIVYIKYQEKHGILLICDESEAEAILSSDCSCGWHIKNMCSYPLDNREYKMVEITKYEYEKLRRLHCKTAEEIIDEYTVSLIKGGLL